MQLKMSRQNMRKEMLENVVNFCLCWQPNTFFLTLVFWTQCTFFAYIWPHLLLQSLFHLHTNHIHTQPGPQHTTDVHLPTDLLKESTAVCPVGHYPLKDSSSLPTTFRRTQSHPKSSSKVRNKGRLLNTLLTEWLRQVAIRFVRGDGTMCHHNRLHTSSTTFCT